MATHVPQTRHLTGLNWLRLAYLVVTDLTGLDWLRLAYLVAAGLVGVDGDTRATRVRHLPRPAVLLPQGARLPSLRLSVEC